MAGNDIQYTSKEIQPKIPDWAETVFGSKLKELPLSLKYFWIAPLGESQASEKMMQNNLPKDSMQVKK